MPEEELPLRFPHFRPEEIKILKKFIDARVIVGKWSTDVRLGYELTEEEKKLAPHEQKMIISLRERRIDAVCETPTEIWILEVKDKLRASGIGQLLTYEYFYKERFKPVKPVRLGYIAAIDDPTLHPLLDEKKIAYWIVPI